MGPGHGLQNHNTFPLKQNAPRSIPLTSADTFQGELLSAGQSQIALQAESSIASPLPRQSSRALLDLHIRVEHLPEA